MNKRFKIRVVYKGTEYWPEEYTIDVSADTISFVENGITITRPIDVNVARCIGERDKNGEDIYEHDIVFVPGHYLGDGWEKEETRGVEWCGGDDCDGPGYYVGTGVNWSECEIVASRYDFFREYFNIE